MIGNVLLALGLPIIPLINKNLSYRQKSRNFDLSDLLKPLWTMHVHVTRVCCIKNVTKYLLGISTVFTLYTYTVSAFFGQTWPFLKW